MSVKDKSEKPIERFYLFHGSNNYKIDRWVTALVKRLISPGAEAFDLDRMSGREIDMPTAINFLSTPPVVSSYRLVILTDIEKTLTSGLNQLETFLDRIPEYSVLAMTATKIDKRLKLFRKLSIQKDKHSFELKPYKPDEAAGLAIKFALDRGKILPMQYAAAMVETFGADPYRLENEIEKLSLFVDGRSEIEKRDLAFSSGFNRVETAFDLPDLIFSGKLNDSLKLAKTAIASGISEMQMLYILKNSLIRLNLAKIEGNAKAIMSTYRMPFKPAQDIYLRSQRTSQEAIAKGLSYIFRAEYSLKSARFPSEAVIEILITALYLIFGGNIPKGRLYLL